MIDQRAQQPGRREVRVILDDDDQSARVDSDGEEEEVDDYNGGAESESEFPLNGEVEA